MRRLALLGMVVLAGCSRSEAEYVRLDMSAWHCSESRVVHYTAYTTHTKVHHYHPPEDRRECFAYAFSGIRHDTIVRPDNHAHWTEEQARRRGKAMTSQGGQ